MALSSQIEMAARAGTTPSPAPDSLQLMAVPSGDPEAEAVERRKAGKVVARRVLRHPCELDPKAGVTQCTHPGHAADAADAREFLEVIGLVDTPVRHRGSGRVSVRHRVTSGCPVCRTRQHVRADGTVGRHGHCPGEGERPLPEEAP